MKIVHTVTTDYFIVPSGGKGNQSDEYLFKLLVEGSDKLVHDRSKLFAIKTATKIIAISKSVSTPAEKLALISAINSLFPINKEIAVRLLNNIKI